MSADNSSKQIILDKAGELFLQQGYARVSIREIAKACGITNAAIYYHFDSKADLAQEFIQHLAENIRESLLTASHQEEDYREKIATMLRTFLKMENELGGQFFTLQREMMDMNLIESPAHSIFKVIFQPLETTYKEAVTAGVLRPLPDDLLISPLLISMLHSYMPGGKFHKRGPKHNISPEAVDVMLDILWYGLSASGNPQITNKETGTL